MRFFGFLLVLSSGLAHAYPEMVRHGYVNCTSCHVSPNGGGMLNGYGRVQAEEVLSTWSREGEGGVGHGYLPSEVGPVSFGGQFRALQMWADTPTARMGRFVMMQADAEAAVKVGPVDIVATAGYQDLPTPAFLSRRHYVLFRPGEESKLMFRVGRFIPAFGLNLADHAIATKGGIGLGQGIESYNLEAAWLGEQGDAFVTLNFGRPGEDRERGISARLGVNVGERAKVGVSYSLGASTALTRHLFGVYAIVGFSERFFLLAEVDLQALRLAAGNRLGPASYARLDYEFVKGLHGYLSAEYSRTNSAGPDSYALGVGTQFFPRPHFEVRLQYDRRQDTYTGGAPSHYGWLMGHYYL